MRFTPSTNWLIAAKAAGRFVRWTMEVKKTTDLSEALTSGTWVDITRYADGSFFPIAQRIEFSVGQFTSDSISVTATLRGIKGIPSISAVQYFENNIFNASASQYLEVRVKGYIGISQSMMSTDAFYAFTGYIDKSNVDSSEDGDTVAFTVFTADELGNRISALNLNTQYYSPDVDGASTPGLIMPKISGMFVVDAGVTSYELNKGFHTVTYNATDNEVKLDDGDYVALSGSDQTLQIANGDGTQKVELYIDASELPNVTGEITEYLVVTTKGDTLCKQLYFGLSARTMLGKIYSQVGITSVTYDTLEMPTNDGAAKVSYLDVPPENASYLGRKLAIVGNGSTTLYIAVGHRVFARTISGYTLVTSLSTSTDFIYRLWYNARNNQIIILASTADNLTKKLARYDLDTLTLSNELTLTSAGDFVKEYACGVMDFEYVSNSWKYFFFYCDANLNELRGVDLSSGTLSGSTIFTEVDLGVDDIPGYFLGIIQSTGYMYVEVIDGVNHKLWEFHIQTDGEVADDGAKLTLSESHTLAAVLHESESRIYYWNASSSKVKSYTLSSATTTDVKTGLNKVEAMYYGNSKVYFVDRNSTDYLKGTLYHVTANTPTTADALKYQTGQTLWYNSDRLYGVNQVGELYQYHTTVAFYLRDPDYSSYSVRDLYGRILQDCNLLSIISANKTASVYRRGNDSGAIVTSGNNLVLNKTNIVSVRRVSKAYQKVDYVEVTNGTVTYGYDGTAFNSGVLDQSRTMTVNSPFIPDEIVKDICKHLFLFFNADHDVYYFQTNIASMEYEVFDGGDVTLDDNRVQITDVGMIQAFGFDQHGNVNCEVIF